jgi:putative cell wall-binding protein
MRALNTIRSKRLRLRPALAVTAASLIAFVAGVGGALSIQGTAGAVGLTPIQDETGLTADLIDALGPVLPGIPAGSTGAAANWTFDVNGNPSSPISDTWADGDTLSIDVTPNGGQVAQNVITSSYVEFSAKPTVILAASGGGSQAAAPTFTTALGTNPADNSNDIVAGLTDQLTITFTNNPGPTAENSFTLLVLGISYTIGAGTGQGAIHAFGNYVSASTGTTPIIVQPNAAVLNADATANTPAVSVLPNSVNQAISPIVINELATGVVDSDPIPGDLSVGSHGYICVQTVTAGSKFVGSPTITVGPSNVGGTAGVEGTVQIETTTLNAPPAGGAQVSTLVAQVLSSSTTTPTTFTISGLEVDAPAVVGPVTVHVLIDENSTCSAAFSPAGSPADPILLPGSPVFQGNNAITIYTVGTAFGPGSDEPIFGSTSEQTAVAALENQLPPAPGGNCLPNNAHPHPFPSSVGSTVVLTTDENGHLDAETASYVAGFYDTGVLLTEGPGELGDGVVVDPYTLSAIQQEGTTTVLIVGGPDAVSAQDMTQLENTPAYECGGSVERTNALGQVEDLQVQRIWGPTADATAEQAADYINSGNVGQVDLSGAFSPNPATDTPPFYNQTLGGASTSSPNLRLRTAIIATDVSSQDAGWASALAYADSLPLLTTPQETLSSYAETGLLDLGIQQVIVVGGNLAVDTPVSAAIEAQGIPVLRIAGTDASQTSVDLAEFELNTDFTSNGEPEGLGWAALQSPVNGAAAVCDPLTVAVGQTYEPDPEAGVSPPFDCADTVALVRGDDTADAMSSSVVTGQNFFPIIATESPTSLGQYATAFFNAAGSPSGVDPIFNPLDPFVPYTGVTIETILPFGGPLALAATTIQAALTAISAGANPPA